MRQPAGELDDLETAVDLTESVGQHLAVFAGQDRGQIALAALDELAKSKEDACSGRERRAAPRPRGLGRRGHGRINDRRIGERDARARLAVRGVVDVSPTVGRCGPRLAGDPVVDGCESRGG